MFGCFRWPQGLAKQMVARAFGVTAHIALRAAALPGLDDGPVNADPAQQLPQTKLGMALIHGGPGLLIGKGIQAGQHHGALGQMRHDGDQGGGGGDGAGGTGNDDGT